MNGLLDEVTIYNRALTGAEVASIFAAGSAGKCRGTTGPRLQFESVNPAVGGNAGQVTVSITGAGFEPAATVNLVSGSQVIVQGTNTTLVSPTVLQTTFDLTTAAAQNVQVQVNNPDPATAMFPFSVISGGAPQVNLQLVGPATARVGRTAPIAAILTSLGSVNTNTVTVSASYKLSPIRSVHSRDAYAFDDRSARLRGTTVANPSTSTISACLLILGLPTGVSVPVQIPIVPPPGSSCTVNVQTNWPPPHLPRPIRLMARRIRQIVPTPHKRSIYCKRQKSC